MAKRWIIRSLFILPILLCMAGWAISVPYYCVLNYYNGQDGYGVATSGGQVVLFCDHGSGPRGWFCSTSRSPSFFTPVFSPDYRRYFGFGALHETTETGVAGPYWFLILAFSAVLFLVWRKTRSKPHPSAAFPVEVKSENGVGQPLS